MPLTPGVEVLKRYRLLEEGVRCRLFRTEDGNFPGKEEPRGNGESHCIDVDTSGLHDQLTATRLSAEIKIQFLKKTSMLLFTTDHLT